MAPESMEGKADRSLTEENKFCTYERVHEHEKRSISLLTVP